MTLKLGQGTPAHDLLITSEILVFRLEAWIKRYECNCGEFHSCGLPEAQKELSFCKRSIERFKSSIG